MTEEKTAEIVENTEKNGSVCLKSRGELARELFREGYNCSQAVTLAFADELEARGISREMATGFEALMGYLYLSGRTGRMVDLVALAMTKTGKADSGDMEKQKEENSDEI